jgi:hypothetical protein
MRGGGRERGWTSSVEKEKEDKAINTTWEDVSE